MIDSYKAKVKKHEKYYDNFEPIVLTETCGIHIESLLINASSTN